MEDYGGCARKCKRIAREEEEEEDEASSAASGLFKRMRTRDSEESPLISINNDLQNRHFPMNSAEHYGGVVAGDSGLSYCSDHHSLASSSCSSSTESCEVLNEHSSKSTDLEQAKSYETENETETESSTCINSKLSSRDTTPASELCGGPSGEGADSDSMESQPKKQPASHQRRPSAAGKKPPIAEIEEFFSVAEKHEQQRFAERYNFDIVKDVPLEGRYQWVRLKP